jgi:uncharacterized protein YdaU (DUF1376 family)
MNHYPHHIGDFNNATRHLSRVERSIYRDLLDLYYDTEKPLRNDFSWLQRRILCDEQDRETFIFVLNEFFVLEADGWHNARCDRELVAYRKMADGGRKGAEVRWGKGGHSHPIATPSEPQWQPEPEPEPKKEKAPAAPSLSFGELESEGLTRETAVEFLALRNRKRARLTRKAWDGIKTEIDKAGWTPERAILKAISRGWTAFEAAWVAEAVKPADIARTTVPADPASFNRTREPPLTAEQKAAAEEVRKKLFPIRKVAACP